jgi:hypothetical protein
MLFNRPTSVKDHDASEAAVEDQHKMLKKKKSVSCHCENLRSCLESYDSEP